MLKIRIKGDLKEIGVSFVDESVLQNLKVWKKAIFQKSETLENIGVDAITLFTFSLCKVT